jgi:hypothetical protein
MSITGYTGGTAHLLDVYNQVGGTDMLYTDYLGNTTVQLGLNVVGGITTYGVSSIGAVNYDGPALSIYGHASGTADLLDVYNQAGGTNMLQVYHNGSAVLRGTGALSLVGTTGQISVQSSVDSSVYSKLNASSGAGASMTLQGTTGSALTFTATGSTVTTFMFSGGNPYNGVTGTSVCTQFIGGICVSF